MEFGTKLKNFREQKGITQQTLANQLFVSRQSVSRWECGSRYPDLMTAKKISDYFNISLDELISEDDILNRQNKQPVMENVKAGRIQTAVYSVALILMLVVISVGFALSECSACYSQLSAYFPMLLPITLFLVFALIKSIQKSLIPKLAGMLISIKYLSDILYSLPLFFLHQPVRYYIYNIVFLIIEIFGIYASVSFFFSEKRTSPRLFYIALALSLAADLNNINSIYLPSTIYFKMYDPVFGIIITYSNIMLGIASALLIGMSICQAHILSKKRKLRIFRNVQADNL